MSGLGKLIGQAGGAAIGEAVQGVGSALGGLAKDLRAAITGETVISEEGKIKLAEIADRLEQREQDLILAQADINKIEAASGSLFVSGWRPSIGWVCSLSLACYFVPKYVLASIFWIKLCWASQQLHPYPVEADGLMELVAALLGMATLRTYERRSGVARNQ